MLNGNSNMKISKLWGVCHTQSCDPPHGIEVMWGMSNTVILKLRGVYRTQLCDPPRGLEITWGFKMSKLSNLISYSLVCLFTCTNWVLSCICERLVKHASRIFVALFEMMLASLYMLVLFEIGVLMLMVDLLNLLIHLTSYLSSWLLACYLLVVSLWGFTLVFIGLGIMVEYSCLNTCLYTLWSTLILISCIASLASLKLCLMSSLPKGRECAQSQLFMATLIGQ
jgi:hypothetical protein